MLSPPRVQHALNQAEAFNTKSLADLDAFMLSAFATENSLKDESSRRFWDLFSMQLRMRPISLTGIMELRGTRQQNDC